MSNLRSWITWNGLSWSIWLINGINFICGNGTVDDDDDDDECSLLVNVDVGKWLYGCGLNCCEEEYIVFCCCCWWFEWLLIVDDDDDDKEFNDDGIVCCWRLLKYLIA